MVGDAHGQLDWDKLRVFHAVAEAGSFTHAGENLGLSQSTVSRQIGALEEGLKVTLFHRHARGLVLTEQGELLFRTVHDVFGKLAMAEAVLTDSKERPRGELKVTTTVGIGTTWLTKHIKEFMDMFPEITVNLLVDDRELDLSMRAADVAIRMREPTQPDLIKRRLMTMHSHCYASPAYIKQAGTPRQATDLDRHRILVYGYEAPAPIANTNWLLTAGQPEDAPPRTPVLQINNVYGLMLACESGLGVASLPDYVAHANKRLVQIPLDVEGPVFDTYFVYPEELRNTKRVIVFRDFLVRKLAEWRF
ncbi:MAG: LysR family transcriptional regulator [Alphaproteobacteria bacterium]|nr:LysR family transcriptional regulator [Alphaproteobacteria bacterium]